MESDNAKVIRKVTNLISTSQFNEVFQYIHDDIVVECPYQAGHQGPMIRGMEKYRVGLGYVEVMFSEFIISIHELHDCPEQDTVVAEFTTKATLSANGKPYGNRYINIFQFRDRKIVLWREFFNPRIANSQLITLFEANHQSVGV